MDLKTGYMHLLPEPRPAIAYTAGCGDGSFLVDVAADGRLIGIEWLGDYDWRDALGQLAMAGRLKMTEQPSGA